MFLVREGKKLAGTVGRSGRTFDSRLKLHEWSFTLRQVRSVDGNAAQNYYYSHSSAPYEFFNRHYRDLYTPDFLATIRRGSRAHLSQRYFAEVRELDPLDQMLYVDTKTWLRMTC